MTALNQIYKCKICGHIIEVLHTGNGTLVCCGQPMELMQEKSADVGMEKHVPVIEKTATGIKVKIGSIPHPMEDKHYIEWIQIFTDGKACRKFLKPGDKPEAEFDVKNITYDSDLQCLVITTGNDVKADNIIAREFCNVHGLWKT